VIDVFNAMLSYAFCCVQTILVPVLYIALKFNLLHACIIRHMDFIPRITQYI